MSNTGREWLEKSAKLQKEISKKAYLINSYWGNIAVSSLAEFSLGRLEKAINNHENKDKIKGMLSDHEVLIDVLKPYKDKFILNPTTPVYSDLYEAKYQILKKKFLLI